MTPLFVFRRWVPALCCALVGPAWAQVPSNVAAPNAVALEVPAPNVPPVVRPARAASAPAAPVQRVEVSAQRDNDTEQRRLSTAAKIVIGREELEKYGDSNVGEMLKRLPGVTVQGQGGRGGQVRMRGLGGGYTQMLLDGERIQGGLSLDSLSPDQIERIEVIRAPTAETGARAIGGTINIITREGFVKRLNDLRLAGGGDTRGGQGGYANWTRNGQAEQLDYTVSGSMLDGFQQQQGDVSTLGSGVNRRQTSQGQGWRQGGDVNLRLQWRLDGGASLMLMPMLFHSRTRSNSVQFNTALSPSLPADLKWQQADSRTEGETRTLRLNSLWRMPLGPGRMETRAGLGRSEGHSRTVRNEDGVAAAYDDEVRSREQNVNLNSKLLILLENGHSLVGGAELDLGQRRERRDALERGLPVAGDFGENLDASSRRVAAYVQDEWTLNPQWAAHAGLRWEGVRTEGRAASAASVSNQSSVWTPLLHAVWKPAPRSRDQIRVSLTRSYRSPTLSDLVGATWRSKGGNSPTNPDRAGNSGLRPELAWGLDVAFEHYPTQGGLFSANVFNRRIADLMRTLTTLEPQADGSTRWVARPGNIGAAVTRGVELEARTRLDSLFSFAPAVEVRANASVFSSKVEGIAGPNNRLDQQPGATANLGGDYKWPGTPFSVGGSLNWTPAYITRLSDSQWVRREMKRVVDAFVLWQVNPNTRLRLSGSNLVPQDGLTVSQVQSGSWDESTFSRSTGASQWRLQLELKL